MPGAPGQPSTIYLLSAPEPMGSTIMSARFNGAVPANVAGRLRQVGAEVDATVPLRDVTLLSDFYYRNRSLWRLISWALAMVTLSVLLLSAAGIYALMSFTVAQRTREIGIRTALGGNPRLILAGIFGRVLRQLRLGLADRLGLFAGLRGDDGDYHRWGRRALVLAVSAMILAVGVTAAIGPARRSLRIPTTEALRAD